MYLFILCTTIFPNKYYNVNPKHLSIVKGIDTFEVYVWAIDVHNNLLVQVVYNEGLALRRGQTSAKTEGGVKVYMEG